MNSDRRHIHFVTGKLAEHAVRYTVEQVAQKIGFDYSIQVLPITVAALVNAKWLLRHLDLPSHASELLLPGYLKSEEERINEAVDVDVTIGPRDIRDLPKFFGQKKNLDEYGQHSIEIIGEINHAHQLPTNRLIATALKMKEDGADVIDLGCTPGHFWKEIGESVKELRQAEIRVSVDSFDANEVELACAAGAELVLSVNSTNWQSAKDWGAEVVVIPDTPSDYDTLHSTVDKLASASVPMRLDPILEPIGCGFTKSIQRYIKCREQYPDATMMMGIGNITELTDSDSAGINVLLLGICQELGIQSILTTEVINWARTSVKECDLARKLVHFACEQGIPPKHLEPALVMLRDERVNEFDSETIKTLAGSIRDRNVRVFNASGEIHAVSRETHVHSEDPFLAMDQLLASPIGSSISPSHAFYLGFEMAKALTANTLGKQYMQDEALNWGFLTREEDHHRLARTHRAKEKESEHTGKDQDGAHEKS